MFTKLHKTVHKSQQAQHFTKLFKTLKNFTEQKTRQHFTQVYKTQQNSTQLNNTFTNKNIWFYTTLLILAEL